MTFTIQPSASILSNSKVKLEITPTSQGMDWSNYDVFFATAYTKSTAATSEAVIAINDDQSVQT